MSVCIWMSFSDLNNEREKRNILLTTINSYTLLKEEIKLSWNEYV